ncbi:hypothetical protein FJV82_21290 [Mesorhizobium sp. WSM4305]|nr:hypothetical protein FJV82_21290 [Mesorhizobium sp. WSM4305]
MGRSGGSLASLRQWLGAIVRERYPKARELTIAMAAAQMERVSGYRRSSSKSSATGLVLHVHHYPPGTSIARLIKKAHVRSRDEDTRLRVPS